MPPYICEVCKFSSNLRANFNRHLLTPKHKKRIQDSYKTPPEPEKKNNPSLSSAHKRLISVSTCSQIAHKSLSDAHKKNTNLGGDSLHVCEFCEKKFSRNTNLQRHLKYYCKARIKEKQDLEFKELIENTVIKQSKQIESLIEIMTHQNQKPSSGFHPPHFKSNIGNGNIGVNGSHNNINNISNTITINNFGSENLDMLTHKFMNSLVDRPYTAIPKMIKKIHFNDKYPENRNIRILNKKDNKIQIIENGRWTYVDKGDTINLLVGDKNCHLDNYYEKNKNQFTHKQNYRFNEFQNKISDDDKKVNLDIVKDTDLVFWNHM